MDEELNKAIQRELVLIRSIHRYEDAADNIISLFKKHYGDTHRVCKIDAAGYIVLPIEQKPSSDDVERCEPTTHDAWISFAIDQYRIWLNQKREKQGNE